MEGEGTGNITTDWLEEIRRAICERVSLHQEEVFNLSTTQAAKVITKKRNWSAPGPERVANFWLKKVKMLHTGIAKSFQAIAQEDHEIPWWFTGGKTSLNPKPGEFNSENHRPITCLNTAYKWFTSCLLKPVDHHLGRYGLMQGEQRGAKDNYCGTFDNLMIDRMVCQDSQRGKRNVSMAWIDVRKPYDQRRIKGGATGAWAPGPPHLGAPHILEYFI